jgi:hypothetical protein
MKETLSKARECTYNAVRTLIVHPSSIQARLYRGYTELLGIESSELGENPMKYQLEGIMNDCIGDRLSSNSNEDARTTIYSMSENEAAKVAERILILFLDMDRELLIQNVQRSR